MDYVKVWGLRRRENFTRSLVPGRSASADKGLKISGDTTRYRLLRRRRATMVQKGIQGFRDMVRAFHDAGISDTGCGL